MLHAVIMAGGSGTRFWPASRRDRPKQFLTLFGERSLIQQATDRCLPLADYSQVWIVTGAKHAVETGRQLPRVPAEHVLIEPCGRNTAPCIGLAAIRVLAEDPDAVMLVTPADHVINPSSAFVTAVERAVATVTRSPEKICLFGIVPDRPATGYGYIERGAALSSGTEGVYSVVRFREKPDLATAEHFLAAGNFLWNSGIFVWRADTIVNALRDHQPELYRRLMDLAKHAGQASWDAALETDFAQMPSISIDYAVLERADSVAVVPAAFEWDDVGSWQALPRLLGADEQGNTIDGPFCGINTQGCIVRTTPDHLVAMAGLTDCIVVHTPDVTLVARKGDEDAVRQLVALAEREGLSRYL